MSTAVGRRVAVGIGELVILDDPTALVVALGLGSCVAVIAHSRQPLLGGLLHFMLPVSTEHNDRSNVARYADTGIRELLRQLQAEGADLRRTEFKLAGGATVINLAAAGGDRFRVGVRNAEAAQAVLREMRVPVRAQDLGGTRGRTVELHVGTGQVLIKTLGEGSRGL